MGTIVKTRDDHMTVQVALGELGFGGKKGSEGELSA